MIEIICAGAGGQGVLVTGFIIAEVAMDAGRHVIWYPSYGAEMRGGTANCNVKISDEDIASPFCKDLDILIAFNEQSLEKFESQVKKNGLVLANSSLISNRRKYRDKIRAVKIPCTDIARELQNEKGANIVMLGALACLSDDFDIDCTRAAVKQFFKKRGKRNPLNEACYDQGVSTAKQFLKSEFKMGKHI